MIYLEYDDKYHEPIIYSYESVDEVIQRIIYDRPTMENPAYGIPYRDDARGTAAETLARDQREWDDNRREILELFDEESDNYHGTIELHINDEFSWVDAEIMEARARQCTHIAERMKRGERLSR